VTRFDLLILIVNASFAGGEVERQDWGWVAVNGFFALLFFAKGLHAAKEWV
jgi:predicted Na+-dependent transporter